MADLDLARRAVAATGWRWMPGMLSTDGRRADDVNTGRNEGIPVAWTEGGRYVEHYEHPNEARRLWAEALPDLDDGATAGCVDVLMRERWGDGYEVMPYVTHICNGGVYEPAPVIWYRLERIGMNPWCSLTHEAVVHPDHPNRYLAGPTRVAALVAALEVGRG
jgi:hypothetical protein